MRARRLQFSIVATAALLVLGACGSSGTSGEESGRDATTTAASYEPQAVNEQGGVGGVGGSDGGTTNGGVDAGPILTDAQRKAAICEAAEPGAADPPPANGSGDARNYAGVAQNLVESIKDECDPKKPEAGKP